MTASSSLLAARKLYESAGFKLEHSEPHVSFGQSLVAEIWTLLLA